MEYFAGSDISMNETHICVVDRNGKVALEAKAPSSPGAIAAELAKAPATKRIVFETGRMAPALYHGLDALGLPVVCIESRQAYQALKSLATHKTDPNDARGLAHLARTGFYKPVHVKSLSAHASWVWLQEGATSDRSGLGILVTGALALAVLLVGRVSRYVLAGE